MSMAKEPKKTVCEPIIHRSRRRRCSRSTLGTYRTLRRRGSNVRSSHQHHRHRKADSHSREKMISPTCGLDCRSAAVASARRQESEAMTPLPVIRPPGHTGLRSKPKRCPKMQQHCTKQPSARSLEGAPAKAKPEQHQQRRSQNWSQEPNTSPEM